MSEENFDDIDECQTYVQTGHKLAIDLHIRLPENPRSPQPSPVSHFPARLPAQGTEKRPAVGSASPRRTGPGLRKPREENRQKVLSSLSPAAFQRTAALHFSKVKEVQPLSKAPPKQTHTSHSEELLAMALTREVDCAWIRLGLRSCSNLIGLGSLLTAMHFLEGTESELLTEIWKALSGEKLGYVSKQSLLNFLFTLHAFKCPARSVDTEASEADPAVISFDDSRALRTRFKSLLVNKKKFHFQLTPAKVASPAPKISYKLTKTHTSPPSVRLKPKPCELDRAGKTLRRVKAELRETEDWPEMLRVWPTAGQSLVEPREPEEPVMLLNVTLPSAETVQLPLYRGDQVELRVREFAAMRGLEKSAESRIVEAVRKQWSSVLN